MVFQNIVSDFPLFQKVELVDPELPKIFGLLRQETHRKYGLLLKQTIKVPGYVFRFSPSSEVHLHPRVRTLAVWAPINGEFLVIITTHVVINHAVVTLPVINRSPTGKTEPEAHGDGRQFRHLADVNPVRISSHLQVKCG